MDINLALLGDPNADKLHGGSVQVHNCFKLLRN
jgi:hypothetical protein